MNGVARLIRVLLCTGGLALAGCGGLTDSGRDTAPRMARADPVAPAPTPDPPTPSTSSSQSVGSGSVKVALLLPLSAPAQAGAAAAAMKNAAELSLSEAVGGDVSLLIKDDRGTPDGAREAAASAVAEGADLIIGPLFAPAVSAASPVARGAGKSIVAFSTDATVATRGVYLLSFLPAGEVDRIIAYAADQGRTAIAALIPDTAYGSVVEGAFREAATRRGLRVVAIERYGSGQGPAAVARLAPAVGGAAPHADALFIPAAADDLPGIGTALATARIDTSRVKLLGTGTWGDPRVARVPGLAGAWFAAPDPAGFAAFSLRYKARYGTEPLRLATLSYDAAALAAALSKSPTARFSEAALQAPGGFSGADGIFRFRPDGTNERALAVSEIRGGVGVVVSPAPKAFGPSGI